MRLHDQWLECVQNPTQHKMLTLLGTILKAPGTVHPQWSRDDFKLLNCTKDFAAALYVTDRMVQRQIKGHPASVRTWEQDIVKD